MLNPLNSASRAGISFVETEPSYDDMNGHGTHIAGTIAALKDGKGLVGVAPHVDLYCE
jgi:subtilisin